MRSRPSNISFETAKYVAISCFVAGTWSYIALQQAGPLELDLLESLDYTAIPVAESGLAVAMPRDFLREPRHGQNGNLALRASVAGFDTEVLQDWPLQRLVVGSAHLNNVVASSKRGMTRDLLHQLFTAGRENG